MIEAEKLTKQYGPLRAIDEVSFKIPAGSIVGLLGPNGAGKTTTLRILTGAIPPTSGTARIGEADIFEQTDAAKKQIGYLPEQPPIYREMTVFDYLDFAAGLRGIHKRQRKEKVEKAMEKTSLTEVRRRLVGHLSKGFRQRVGLAQALVHEPKVLILDEPTIGLDPKQILEIRELIKNLSGGMTVIFSSHILPEVSALCERVIIIHQGKIVADDTIAGLSHQIGKTRLIVTSSESKETLVPRLKTIAGVDDVQEAASSLEEIFINLTGNS